MNRRDTAESYQVLMQKIRSLKNFVAVRSTFIVGFPTETDKDFENLKTFLKEQKMQYVGFFKYSREEYTVAYNMPHQVKEKVKEARLREAEMLQENIMIESQEQFVGKTITCVLEKIESDGLCVLRSEYNSPDIDTIIYAQNNGKKLKVGEFYQIKIESIDGIDLKGEIL
jgi:ribosomal protein S12 methylthiotransferase